MIVSKDIVPGSIHPQNFRWLDGIPTGKYPVGIDASGLFFEDKKVLYGSYFCENWHGFAALGSNYYGATHWTLAKTSGVLSAVDVTYGYGATFYRSGAAEAANYGYASLSAEKSVVPNQDQFAFAMDFQYDPTYNTNANAWQNKHTAGTALGLSEDAFFDIGLVATRGAKSTASDSGPGETTLAFTAKQPGTAWDGYTITIEFVEEDDLDLEITEETEEGVTIQLATDGDGAITTAPEDLNDLEFLYIKAHCIGATVFDDTYEVELDNGSDEEALVLRAIPGTGATWKLISATGGDTVEVDTGIVIVQTASVAMWVQGVVSDDRMVITVKYAVGGAPQNHLTFALDSDTITPELSAMQMYGFYQDRLATANNDVRFDCYSRSFSWYRRALIEA